MLTNRAARACRVFPWLWLAFAAPLGFAADNQGTLTANGNAFMPENTMQLSVDGIRHNGWGVSYVAPAGTATWFHAPLQTTAMSEKQRLQVKTVYVLFKSKQSVITDIQLWDGALLLQTISRLQLAGNHSVKISDQNQFAIQVPYPITFGLGISVGVTFGNDGTQGGRQVGEMMFTGAGVGYEN